MKTFGAQYVVHEDSGFLAESVRRIYPLMDRILFLIGWEPWNGAGDPALPRATIRTILDIPDPGRKFAVSAKVWKDEKDQRNEGVAALRAMGCEWCLIVDDDEFYNRAQLLDAMGRISDDTRATAFLVPQVIYWKERGLAIDRVTQALPTFVSTAKDEVYFNIARNIQVRSGTWGVFQPEVLVCHHMSYVRSDEKMRRKLAAFTHADKRLGAWYERVWLGWKPDMEDLHPNPEAPWGFKRAVPASSLPWTLEPAPA